MLNVPVQVYITIMVLHEDPLEDVQSLFCELIKNEEQEERTSSFQGVNQLIV